MFTRFLAVSSVCLFTTSTLALAAATAEDADRIKASLQTYLGSEPGVVAVTPDGDDYVITLDAMPYLIKLKASGFEVSLDQTVLRARPLGNGQWLVSQSGPYSLSWKAEGISSMDAKVAALDWNGTFDENLFAFLESSMAIKGMTVSQVIDDPQNKIKTSAASSIESWTASSKSQASATGTVDSEGTSEFSGITTVNKSEMPPEMMAAGMPNFSYTATAAGGQYLSAIKGFKSRQVMELLAWFVAHPTKEEIVRDQAALKQKIAAALPLWDNLNTNGKFQNVAVSTSVGNFTVASGGSGVTLSGATKSGSFGETFGISGLTIPGGLAPPWTEGLIPSDFNIDFTVDGFDLEAPAKLFLAQVDFAKDPPLPPNAGLLFLPAFAPSNTIHVSLKDGAITAPAYQIAYDGNMTINLSGLPTGKANIRMTGLEDVLAKVQAAAATDPTAQQAMGGLVAFKGFGKAQADGSLLWAIEVTPDAKVLVNGLDVSAMTGMAPPPQQ